MFQLRERQALLDHAVCKDNLIWTFSKPLQKESMGRQEEGGTSSGLGIKNKQKKNSLLEKPNPIVFIAGPLWSWLNRVDLCQKY